MTEAKEKPPLVGEVAYIERAGIRFPVIFTEFGWQFCQMPESFEEDVIIRMGDVARHIDSLREVLRGVRAINDTLHGSMLASKGGSAPEPVATLRRNIDTARSLAAQIDDEILTFLGCAD
jgi:hypothetical protein